MLSDPNVCIGNSEAYNYSTQYDEGLVNVTKWGAGDRTMGINGSMIQIKLAGHLPSLICDKCRVTLEKDIIQDVKHCPNIRCGIFSIIKLLLES